MNGNLYGYARVSTREQNLERQIISLMDFGVASANIYTDKQSGKDFERPAYKRLLRTLRRGDLLAVPSIDRLGRDYADIMEQWKYITKKKQAHIVVLDMKELLDTRLSKDVTGIFISDIVLQLLSYVAQKERENIRERQAQGIAAAKARGVKFGRAALPLPDNFNEVYSRWLNHEINCREAAKLLDVCHVTFLRWVKR